MSGYFDDDEEDVEREPEEGGGDTEVRLSPLGLLGIFFGLVLLCGLCFGLGYTVGHRTAGPAVASAQHEPPADQEPLQGNASVPKPSAAEQAPTTPASPPPTESTPPAAETATSPAAAQPGTGASTSPSSAPASAVRPGNPAAARPQPVESSPYVHPALPAPPGQFMVQIAAVSHVEDADVLVTALRRHGYVVTSRREPGDGLIHVRIGPFSSHDEAVRWRNKLLGDGYNAEVQP